MLLSTESQVLHAASRPVQVGWRQYFRYLNINFANFSINWI